jgi:leucyl aminopeptidase
MDLSVLQGQPFDTACDVLVLPVMKGKTKLKELDPKLQSHIEAEEFEGGFGEWICLPSYGLMKAKKVALLGMGEKSSLDLDHLRRAGALMLKRVKDARGKNVHVSLANVAFADKPSRELLEAFFEGMLLASYGFHAYHKKNAERHAKTSVKKVTFFEEGKAAIASYEKALFEAGALAEATCLARDLVNTPSEDMFPARMADVAKEVAASSKELSVKFLDKDRMERMKMHAALAVGRGSMHEPVGVHLSYKPKTAKKKIALVGKAVTFDSGGLSLKPADGMLGMKMDMGGAAAVLGLFKALPSLAPDVEVHGIFLAVENMPSGSAYRPGDVVRAMNGVTIEVQNTDAEGRVVLADALSYAATLKPDIIIDLATLTGACIVALGEEIAGAMGNDRRLMEKLIAAGSESGDWLWQCAHRAHRVRIVCAYCAHTCILLVAFRFIVCAHGLHVMRIRLLNLSLFLG